MKMNLIETEWILFATPNLKKRTETFQMTINGTVKHVEDNDSMIDFLKKIPPLSLFISHVRTPHYIKKFSTPFHVWFYDWFHEKKIIIIVYLYVHTM